MAFSFNRYCSDNLPAGKYKAVVTAAKFRMGADGGATKDIAVTYTVAEGTYAKRVFSDTIFEKAHSFRLRPFLQACGVDISREFNSMEEMFQYGMKEVVGKTIMVDVSIRTYNGREYNNVDGWSALPGSTTGVDDVLAEFGEDPTVKAETSVTTNDPKAEAKLKAAKKAEAAPTAEAPAEPKLSFDVAEDDLPF